MSAALIAIDWGSTNFRASLLDARGARIDGIEDGAGVFNRAESFADQLRRVVDPWRARAGNVPAILSGMIGSRNGLIEVPYISCPAGVAELAVNLHPIDTAILDRCWIVPGLRGLTPEGVADVMRGEEVQIFGMLAERAWESGNGLVILPGTHSKWALLRGGAVFRFATAISGELFATLTQQGSLATLLSADSAKAFDSEVFRKGLTHARQQGGLTHHLFNLRARAVLGEIPAEELRTRLSALIIGHEMTEMLAMFPAAQRVAVVGSSQLGRIYCEALAARGAEATYFPGEAAATNGAIGLARQAGILETA